MQLSRVGVVVIGSLLASCSPAFCNSSERPVLVQGSLIAPDGHPFHLKAVITEGHDPSPVAEVEMFWAAPDMWRRTIKSQDFNQTLVVNGSKVFETDSDSYIPLGIETLVANMIDPTPLLDAYRAGDRVLTKANGASDESGILCFDSTHRACLRTPYGLMESVEVPGHKSEFTSYQSFHGKRIARRLVYTVSMGDFMTAEVTKLEDLKHPEATLFAVDKTTRAEDRIRVASLEEPELRALARKSPEIIWPQVLDDTRRDPARFLVSMDSTGKVREVLPLDITHERSNDSAVRQLMRWQFKPAERDGRKVQAEGILTFDVDTRKWGPKEPLTDAEVRKLVSNAIQPVVAAGSLPTGTEYRLWIAVDSDGIVIEKIAGGGPSQLFGPIDKALRQWKFSPILEDGQPRPYRAELVFRFN